MKGNKKTIDVLLEISRLLLGALFLFSGFVKLVDPMGFAYKFSDYFMAFQISFLVKLALPLAIALPAFELLIGAVLFLRLRMHLFSLVALGTMVFFTILTLVIAIWNPVTDCGCFGDALVITNWQTFYKNLIFLGPALFIYKYRNRFVNTFIPFIEWIFVFTLLLLGGAFSWYNYLNDPILDFRPYKVGTDIPIAMSIPDGSPLDIWEYSVVYQKDGRQVEFAIDSLPDTSWNWVETKQRLIQEGYRAPIQDFSMVSEDADDIAHEVLADQGYSLFIIAYNLEKADKKGVIKINELYNTLSDKGYQFYCLTASLPAEIASFKSTYNPGYGFYVADDITLKTIIRSNPGVMLIKEGVVLAKWHHRNLPENPDFFTVSGAIRQAEADKDKLFVFLSIALFLLLALAVRHLLQVVWPGS